jgi:hypothetical protein
MLCHILEKRDKSGLNFLTFTRRLHIHLSDKVFEMTVLKSIHQHLKEKGKKKVCSLQQWRAKYSTKYPPLE